MIVLAYDGSLNGDWVSRYAIRFAAHVGTSLSVLHVSDGSLEPDKLSVKLQRLERESHALGVEAFTEILPLEKSVYFTLLAHITPGRENIVVCGTRVRIRQRHFLSGTIAEKLLRTGHFPVLALRVVQPGLLGTPRNLLLPLAGHPRGFEAAWPFFRLLLPEVDRLFLLRCMNVSSLRLPHLSETRRTAIRLAGERYLGTVEDEILRRRGSSSFRLDWRVSICDDWVHEALVQASRLKVRMLLLGATERPLGHRLLHGNALERVLRGTPCDVGIYRSL